MTLLHIETSTNVCSIALSKDGMCLLSLIDRQGQNHAALLSNFIRQAVEKAQELNIVIEGIAVSGGPGSYTGLRIGVSTAKGLCYGYEIPLVAVDTLEVLCNHPIVRQQADEESLLCPMIDARRMEVYAAVYTHSFEKRQKISAKIISENSFCEELNSGVVCFFGNGAEKCKTILAHHPQARFIEGIEPLAENMILLGEKKFYENDFVDVAYYEPLYLKEFQTTTPKAR
ncbi:MAG: tRNA (adenosine(37)-N6)-threonylcarbamoyltransferase complex dimerization subunit type 1 TsaB [Paludibacteraceae bacterium]